MTVEGKPARAATVRCDAIYTALPPQVAKCDGNGGFALDVVSQPSYRLLASSGYSHGLVDVSHANAVVGPIHIKLHQLLYEKVSFVTRDGTPVPVTGRQECALFAQEPVYESFYNIANYDVSWLPSEITIATLAENDLVYITTKKVRDGPGARVLDFQGYEPVDIPEQLLPLQQWPQGREIVLAPDVNEAPAVPHRVVFPDLAFPAGWATDSMGRLDIIASVTTMGENARTYWVSQKHPIFRVPRGTADSAALKVLSDRATRRFDLRDGRDEIDVLVDWPRYAFLDLRYPASQPGVPEATSVATVWSGETFVIGGRLVEPGHARFAYLPEGDYLVEISWWKNDEASPFSTWRVRAPISLGMGLNECEVREDDVQAEASR